MQTLLEIFPKDIVQYIINEYLYPPKKFTNLMNELHSRTHCRLCDCIINYLTTNECLDCYIKMQNKNYSKYKPKVVKKFICKFCHTTFIKSSLHRHSQTKMHLNNVKHITGYDYYNDWYQVYKEALRND